ncbi:MAG: septum formation protein Maf [Saprospirales bacterium]|nr:MAG: septum formation protein Maf [Saprospirales bacterium]
MSRLSFPPILLASASPRRAELLTKAGFTFRQIVPMVEEQWPQEMEAEEIPEYLAGLKAEAVEASMLPGEFILTADSIVVLDGEVIGKPKDDKEAKSFLRKLSGRQHQVITGVCILSETHQSLGSETAHVTMDKLHEEEIDFYIKNYQPLDKAGAYGIQEWLGLCRVSEISGSYSNIMGLPMHLVYEMIKSLQNSDEEE